MSRRDLIKKLISEARTRDYLSTSNPILDELFHGWPRRSIGLIYGTFKAGKTTMALMAALNVVKQGKRVIYLDTENGVDDMRLLLLADAMGLPEDVIANLGYWFRQYQASNLKQQGEVITLWSDVARSPDVGLLVVDSIAQHFHRYVMQAPDALVGSYARDAGGRLEKQINRMLEYVQDNGASILLTSWTLSKAVKQFSLHRRRQLEKELKAGKAPSIGDVEEVFQAKDKDFVGSRVLGYLAKVIIRIVRLEAAERFIVVDGHRSVGENRGVYATITQGGIIPRPPIVDVTDEMRRKLLGIEKALEEAEAKEGGRGGKASSGRRGASGRASSQR